MMKKLLILMLVLGLASAANALTLNLTVNGVDPGAEYTMNICDVISIGVNSDGVVDAQHYNAMYNATLVINPAGTEIGTGVWDGVANPPGYTLYDGVGEPLEFLKGPPPASATVMNTQVAMLTASTPVLNDYAQAGIGADFAFHCTGPLDTIPPGGDVTILLIDQVTGPADTLTIHQIPEPATMLLLGLGGLFLRRRK